MIFFDEMRHCVRQLRFLVYKEFQHLNKERRLPQIKTEFVNENR